MKGFSVLQPGLGAPLSWMPAVGSKELAQLINAYLPGPASAQDKRAVIATDFFKFAAETGESFKYYQVTLPQATASPASSAVTTSPTMSSMSYGSPSQPSTPAPGATSSRTAGTKSEKTDYSHLPGMKILTTDGQDVTNSLSRGCKTKEQREHAHLMRVLKACDACKKKKIRCDPSHKRRPSSQTSPKAVAKSAKKARKSTASSASQATPAASTSAAFTPATDLSFDFEMDLNMDFSGSFDDLPAIDMDELFDFNQTLDTVPQDFYGTTPQNFEFYLGNDSLYSPAVTGSTGSYNSPAQPLTPNGSGLLPQGDFTAFNDTNAQAFLQSGDQEPSLPYMTPGPHGSNYVDFNLYSPSSSFIDEEPMKLKAGGKRKNSASPAESPTTHSQVVHGSESPAGLHEGRPSAGLADDHASYCDHIGQGIGSPQMLRSPVPCDRLQQQVATSESVGGVVSNEDQRPYHGDDGGHHSPRAATTTRPLGSQDHVVSRNSPVPAATLSGGHERNNLLHQNVIALGGNAHELSRTVSPSVCASLAVVFSKFSTDTSIGIVQCWPN